MHLLEKPPLSRGAGTLAAAPAGERARVESHFVYNARVDGAAVLNEEKSNTSGMSSLLCTAARATTECNT